MASDQPLHDLIVLEAIASDTDGIKLQTAHDAEFE